MSGINARLKPDDGIVQSRTTGSAGNLTVDNHATSNNEIFYPDSAGTFQKAYFAARRRYECYIDDTDQVVTGSDFQVIQINGNAKTECGLMQLWNTSSHILTPEVAGYLYTLQFCSKASVASDSPVLHIALALSGANLTDPGLSMEHHQVHEMTVVKKTDHNHIHANFHFLADATLVSSGMQLYANSSGAQITLHSASFILLEG